jgi:hypothetical protein
LRNRNFRKNELIPSVTKVKDTIRFIKEYSILSGKNQVEAAGKKT